MKLKIGYILALISLQSFACAVSAEVNIPGIGGVGASIGSDGVSAGASALGIGAEAAVGNQGVGAGVQTPAATAGFGDYKAYAKPSIFNKYKSADVAILLTRYPTGEASVSIMKSEYFESLPQIQQDELLKGIALQQQAGITYFYKVSSDGSDLILLGT
jgi:hypothetical protein